MIDEPEAVSEFDVVVVAEPRPRVSQAPTLSVPLLRTTALFWLKESPMTNSPVRPTV